MIEVLSMSQSELRKMPFTWFSEVSSISINFLWREQSTYCWWIQFPYIAQSNNFGNYPLENRKTQRKDPVIYYYSSRSSYPTRILQCYRYLLFLCLFCGSDFCFMYIKNWIEEIFSVWAVWAVVTIHFFYEIRYFESSLMLYLQKMFVTF